MLGAISLPKTYDQHPALTDLNLTVNPGDVYCLFGANGAGKTTTINLTQAERTGKPTMLRRV